MGAFFVMARTNSVCHPYDNPNTKIPLAHRPIDLDPDHNGLKTSWPVAATMPIEVMEGFAREVWIGLGWQIGSDSMHFQPTR